MQQQTAPGFSGGPLPSGGALSDGLTGPSVAEASGTAATPQQQKSGTLPDAILHDEAEAEAAAILAAMVFAPSPGTAMHAFDRPLPDMEPFSSTSLDLEDTAWLNNWPPDFGMPDGLFTDALDMAFDSAAAQADSQQQQQQQFGTHYQPYAADGIALDSSTAPDSAGQHDFAKFCTDCFGNPTNSCIETAPQESAGNVVDPNISAYIGSLGCSKLTRRLQGELLSPCCLMRRLGVAHRVCSACCSAQPGRCCVLCCFCLPICSNCCMLLSRWREPHALKNLSSSIAVAASPSAITLVMHVNTAHLGPVTL